MFVAIQKILIKLATMNKNNYFNYFLKIILIFYF